MQAPATVLIVDPDGPTRDAICRLADRMNLASLAYAQGGEFLRAHQYCQPGCVVLEVRIPDASGLQIQSRLNAEGVTIPLVFLTAEANVHVAVRAIRAGAVHFLEKPARDDELWDAIEEAISIDQQRREARQRQQRLDRQFAGLSIKEERVFEMIGDGKSTREIASELKVSVRAIELRRNSLMKKLDIESPAELVRMAWAAREGNGAVRRHLNRGLELSRGFSDL